MSDAHMSNQVWDDAFPTSSGSDCEEAPAHLQLQHGKMKKRGRAAQNALSMPEKKGSWSEWEELELIKRHREIGNKWATIAKFLPGRSDNGVKNHWNSTLRSKSAARHETFLWIYAKQVEPVAECKESRADVYTKAKAEYLAIAEQAGPTSASGEESSVEPYGAPPCVAMPDIQPTERRAKRASVNFTPGADAGLGQASLLGLQSINKPQDSSDDPDNGKWIDDALKPQGCLSGKATRNTPTTSSSRMGPQEMSEDASAPFSSFIFMGPPSSLPISIKQKPDQLKGGPDANLDAPATMAGFNDIYNTWGTDNPTQQQFLPLTVITDLVPNSLHCGSAGSMRAEECEFRSPSSGGSEVGSFSFRATNQISTQDAAVLAPSLLEINSRGSQQSAMVEDAVGGQEGEEDGVDPMLFVPGADADPGGVHRSPSFFDAHMLVRDLMDPSPASSEGAWTDTKEGTQKRRPLISPHSINTDFYSTSSSLHSSLTKL